MFESDEHTVRELTSDHVGKYFVKYEPRHNKPIAIEGVVGINDNGTYIAQVEDPKTREVLSRGQVGRTRGIYLWQPMEER